MQPTPLSPRSAAAAYRRDVAGRAGEPFGPSDGEWITVASRLAQSCARAAPADVDDVDADLQAAADAAVRATNRPPVDLTAHGAVDPSAVVSAVLDLVLDMERAGALHLASATIDALEARLRGMSARDAGMIVLARARLAWRSGDAESADELYGDAARHAKRIGDAELLARARVGFLTLAQIRGDMSAVKRWSRRILRWKDIATVPDVARGALHGMMLAAVSDGDLVNALEYGWRFYAYSADDHAARADALTNLAQLLLDLGYPDASRAAFSAVLAETQAPRIAFPALGGFAVASARMNDIPKLEWSTTELLRVSRAANAPYPAVHALMECAGALLIVGLRRRAVECRDAALAIATEYAQPDLIARAHDLSPITALHASTPARGQRVRAVVEKIEALRPNALPAHIALTAA